jgi:integrase
MLRTEDQLLFPDPRGGVFGNKVLNRWYRDLATESGVRRITSHGARQTAGSSYAVMGAGQKVIGRCSATAAVRPPSATPTSPRVPLRRQSRPDGCGLGAGRVEGEEMRFVFLAPRPDAKAPC